MIRTIFAATCVLALPLAAVADDKPRDPRVEEILKDLPSRGEIDEMLEAMPDVNGLVTGLRDIAEDPDTMETLERVGSRLEGLGETLEAQTADGEMPDFNSLISELMYLATDEEIVGDVLGLAFQVSDLMEEIAPELAEE